MKVKQEFQALNNIYIYIYVKDKFSSEKYICAVAACYIFLRLNPYDAEVYFNRCNAKANLEDFSGALTGYDKALMLCSRKFTDHFGSGKVKML